MPLLTATSVKKLFGGVVALSNGNLTCESGRITGLLGTNGSGKSTISKIITGVYAKDGGTILYEGREIAYKNPHEAKMDGISMVFQNLSLIPDLTVWQNIALGIEEKKGIFLNNASAVKLAEEIIGELMPSLNVNRRVCDLNPGEQQITEIAKAISVKPKLLIFDEPTAALEQEEVRSLFAYMRKLAKEGVAMIFTSHRLWEVMEICDDIVVFRNGENVGSMDFSKDGKDAETIVRMITGNTEGIHIAKEYHEIEDVPVLSIENLTYVINAIFCFFVAVYYAGQNGAGNANLGDSLTLQAVASAVVGGVAMSGGKGSVYMSIAGALIMSLVGRIIYFANIPNAFQTFVSGIIIIAAIAMSSIYAFQQRKAQLKGGASRG